MLIAGWEQMGELQRIAAVAKSEECAGMTAQEVADYINTPRQVGSTLRGLSAEEVYSAISTLKIAQLEAASVDFDAAANAAAKDKAAAGVVLSVWLANVGGVEMAVGSEGRKRLDAAVTAGYLAAADLVALVGRATVPTTWCMATAPVAEGGFAWTHDATAADVDRALSEVTV